MRAKNCAAALLSRARLRSADLSWLAKYRDPVSLSRHSTVSVEIISFYSKPTGVILTAHDYTLNAPRPQTRLAAFDQIEDPSRILHQRLPV
jgi:hypothetical protein